MTDTVFENCDIIDEYQDLLHLCFSFASFLKAFLFNPHSLSNHFLVMIFVFASSFDYFSLKRL